jgi:hypothetical protein
MTVLNKQNKSQVLFILADGTEMAMDAALTD